MLNKFKRTRCGGSMLIYQMVGMVLMLVLASFSVDFGHVQLVKMQLQCAADAASLAATEALAKGADARAAATAVAAANLADNAPVTLATSDVELGHWNRSTDSFVAGGTPTDAVRVTAKRSAARGDAVQMFFAQIFGQKTCNATNDATSYVNQQIPDYAFAAAGNFSSHGLLTVDSYPTFGQGNIEANGDINLNLLGLIGLTCIDGDCRPGPGKTIKKPLIGITKITGDASNLGATKSYPAVNGSDYATNNNNNQLTGGLLDSNGNFTTGVNATIPAGNYYVKNLTVLAGLNLQLDGPVTFYVTGNTTILANIIVPNNDPSNFKIRVAGSGTITSAVNLNLYADIYAPQSDINIAAGGSFHGRMCGNNVNILGTSFLHYNTDLKESKPPTSSLVK